MPVIQEVMALAFKEVRRLVLQDKEPGSQDLEAALPPCPTQPSLLRGFKACFTQHRELLDTPLHTPIQASRKPTKPLHFLPVKLPLLLNTKLMPMLQALLSYLDLPSAWELGRGD